MKREEVEAIVAWLSDGDKTHRFHLKSFDSVKSWFRNGKVVKCEDQFLIFDDDIVGEILIPYSFIIDIKEYEVKKDEDL